jgi:TetR/AcrR family transcriptional repressor of nem operon
MEQGTDTREEILRTAARMLQTRGFSAFSYGHIAEAIGIRPAAIHYHFRTKTDLGVELVRRYRERFQRWTGELDRLPAQERLGGYFAFFERLVADGRVCAGGVLLAEFHALPDEMKEEVGRLVTDMHGWLGRVLREGRKAGQLAFVGRPEDKASVIGAAVQGAVQAARTLGIAHFRQTVAQLRRELEPR